MAPNMAQDAALDSKDRNVHTHSPADVENDLSRADVLLLDARDNVHQDDLHSAFDSGRFHPIVTSTPAVERSVFKMYDSVIAFPRLDEDSGLGGSFSFSSPSSALEVTSSQSLADIYSPIVTDSPVVTGSDVSPYITSSGDQHSPVAMDQAFPRAVGTSASAADSGVLTQTSLWGLSEMLRTTAQSVLRHSSTPICTTSGSALLGRLFTKPPHSARQYREHHHDSSNSSSASSSPVKQSYVMDRFFRKQHARDQTDAESDDEAYHSASASRFTLPSPLIVDEESQSSLAEQLERCEVTPESEKRKAFQFDNVHGDSECEDEGLEENVCGASVTPSRDRAWAAVNGVNTTTDCQTYTEVRMDETPAVFDIAAAKKSDTDRVEQRTTLYQTDKHAVHICKTLEEIVRENSPAQSDRLIGRCVGFGQMDVVGELNSRGLPAQGVVSWLWGYLDENDFIRMSYVCRLWRRIVMKNPKVRKYCKLLQRIHSAPSDKENQLQKKHPCASPDECKGMTRSAKCLGTVQRAVLVPKPDAVRSPVFERVRQELSWEEFVRQCPQCQHAATLLPCYQAAACSNPTCGFQFCVCCLRAVHAPEESCPKKQKTADLSVKKNRKYLKRICKI